MAGVGEEFGEADLITTFLTSDMGKVAAIAKYARRSKKRFAGILELFSVLRVVCSQGRGLPILQEASLEQPFANIRTDIRKTAYASYWAELISAWTEEGESQDQLYHLFRHVLEALDAGTVPAEVLSILFQMRLMSLSGFSPNLSHCGVCGVRTEDMRKSRLIFGLARGELVCEKCAGLSVKGNRQTASVGGKRGTEKGGTGQVLGSVAPGGTDISGGFCAASSGEDAPEFGVFAADTEGVLKTRCFETFFHHEEHEGHEEGHEEIVKAKDVDLVDAEKFIAATDREPFDYTEWQKKLWEGMSVEQISRMAMENYEKKQKE